MKLANNKLFMGVLIAACVFFIWYGVRSYNRQKNYEALGLILDDIERYSGTDAWNNPDNWEGYEAGDPLPDAVKID